MPAVIHEHAVSLLNAIAERAAAAPAQPALTFYRGRARVARLGYAELVTAVEAAAAHMAHALGVGAGDRVALLAPNRPELAIAALAAMRLGAAIVPLNPTAPPDDWAYIVGHAEPRAVLADVALLPAARALPAPASPIDALGGDPRGLPPPAAAPDALAVVLYTSGTTGQPKGVALSQRNVLYNGGAMAQHFGLDGSTQMAVLPLYHAHAFGFGLMSALASGGHLVLCERFDPFAWPEVIRAEAVAVTSVVPALLPALLQTRVRAERVPTLRHLLVSSAPLPAELARRFAEETGIALAHGWGLSEYTNFACCMPLGASVVDGELTCVGKALPGTEVRVDASGELCVRGPSRMLGYLRDPEATAAAIDAAGWLHTGDQGMFRERDGRVLFYVTGRIKEIIIRAGEKLSPLAIERRIFTAAPELDGRLVVLGFAHRTHGEEVGAYLEADGVDEPTRARLAAAIEALPPDQRPKVVLWGPAPIPRTHTGKIQRRKLQPLFAPFVDAHGATRVEPVVLMGAWAGQDAAHF